MTQFGQISLSEAEKLAEKNAQELLILQQRIENLSRRVAQKVHAIQEGIWNLTSQWVINLLTKPELVRISELLGKLEEKLVLDDTNRSRDVSRDLQIWDNNLPELNKTIEAIGRDPTKFIDAILKYFEVPYLNRCDMATSRKWYDSWTVCCVEDKTYILITLASLKAQRETHVKTISGNIGKRNVPIDFVDSRGMLNTLSVLLSNEQDTYTEWESDGLKQLKQYLSWDRVIGIIDNETGLFFLRVLEDTEE